MRFQPVKSFFFLYRSHCSNFIIFGGEHFTQFLFLTLHPHTHQRNLDEGVLRHASHMTTCLSASSTAALSCSWADDASLADRTLHLALADNGMEQAERIVQAALRTPRTHAVRISLADKVVAAPWLELTVGLCGIAAVCVVTSARVLEIYEVGAANRAATTPPLLTQEAQLRNEATCLCAHFLCHGNGGALFPPHHTYRLKLFSRLPSNEACVTRVCLIYTEAAAVPPPLAAPSDSPTLQDKEKKEGRADGSAVLGEEAVLEAIFGIQRQLLMMERRLGSALRDVTQRLTGLEARVDRLETQVSGDSAHEAGASMPVPSTPLAAPDKEKEEEEGVLGNET